MEKEAELFEQLKVLGNAYNEQRKIRDQTIAGVKDLRERILDTLEKVELTELRTEYIHILKSIYEQEYFNKRQFREDEPEMYAKYTEKRSYTKLTVNEVKKENENK